MTSEQIRSKLSQGKKLVHFSIDDSILSLQEAFSNRSRSLFDFEYFQFLKSLHETTGTIITNYLFYSNQGLEKTEFHLGMLDDHYRKEFITTASWLKWGLHGLCWQQPMNTQTTEEIKTMSETSYSALRTAMSESVLAQTWRPHFYSADRDACEIMRDTFNIDLLLTPEDNRKLSACLDPVIVKKMQNCGLEYDPSSRFTLLHTLFRIEDESLNIDSMKQLMDTHIERHGIIAFYTHEPELMTQGSNVKIIRKRTLELLQYAASRGYTFIS